MYQIVRIKFQYVRIFSHPLIYQMGLSIFDLASPSYAGYLRQYQYGRKAKPSLIERRLYARILQIMEDKKPYLDPQFNLCQLANLACTNRTRLSSTLNNQTGMNFSRWLAIYRVEYLIREFSKCLTQEPQELYKTAGFTSRTSFYRQFKEVTGNTPIEYFANLYYNNVNDSTK